MHLLSIIYIQMRYSFVQLYSGTTFYSVVRKTSGGVFFVNERDHVIVRKYFID